MYNRININYIKFSGVLMCFILLPALSFAQVSEGCGFGGDNDPTGGNTQCPLDTWVWVLVVAAAIFGAIKLYAHKKEQNQYS